MDAVTEATNKLIGKAIDDAYKLIEAPSVLLGTEYQEAFADGADAMKAALVKYLELP